METGTLVHVDPSELLLDTNVRTQVRIDADFKASIKNEGVLEPVVAVQTAAGLLVRFGQRRTLAAVEVAEPAIPVYVISDDGDVDRIIAQMAENDQRAALSPAERIDAVQQLSLLGVSAAQITKRTRVKRTHVDAAIAIIGNDNAMKIARDYTLAVAGWCAEFADDEAKVAEILRQAQWGEDRARHAVERYRQEAGDAAAYAEAAAAITDQTVIERPTWQSVEKPVSDLTDGKKPLDPEAHKSCPGHAVVLDEVDIDQYEGDEDGADTEPVPFDLDVAGRKWEIISYCTDPDALGHTWRYARTHTGVSSDARSDDPNAKAKASAERKRVIAGNKAWVAATVVRLEFVQKLLTRKSVPDHAVLFVLRALSGRVDLGEGRAALLERVRGKDGHGPITIGDLTGPQATMALLDYVITAMEKGTGRDDWRTTQPSTALYLKALESWGYGLSDVEVAASGGKKFTA